MEADVAGRGAPLRPIVVRETAWNTAGAYSALLLNVAVTAVLARVLSPDDFGILAAVVTFTAFFDSLASVSLGGAVLQRRALTERDLSTVFWFTVAASGAVFLLLQAAVAVLGHVLTSPEFTTALRVLALNVVLVGVAVVPAAVLRRRLRLRFLALSRWIAVLAAAGIAIPMAFAGYGYWALVGQSLATYGIQALATLGFSRWRPERAFDRGTLASLFRYSSRASLHVTVNYWARNAGNLLIARFAGAAALGQYNLAQRVLSLPVQLLESALGPTLQPTFALLGDDLPRLRRAYAGFVQLAGVVSFPVAAVLALAADPLVHVLWGGQWTESVAIVHALVPVAAVQPVNAVNGSLFLARDDAPLLVRVSSLNALAVFVGMVAGLPWGAVGVAWGYSVAYVCVAAPHAALTAQAHVLRGTAREYAAWLARPLTAGALVLAAGWSASFFTPAGAGALTSLLVLVAGSLLGFLVAVRLTAWSLVAPLLGRGAGTEGAEPVATPPH